MFDVETQSKTYNALLGFAFSQLSASVKFASQIAEHNLNIAKHSVQTPVKAASETITKSTNSTLQTFSTNPLSWGNYWPNASANSFPFMPQLQTHSNSLAWLQNLFQPNIPAWLAPISQFMSAPAFTPQAFNPAFAWQGLSPKWQQTNMMHSPLNFDFSTFWKPRQDLFFAAPNWLQNPMSSSLPWSLFPWSPTNFFSYMAPAFPYIPFGQTSPWQNLWQQANSPFMMKGFMVFFAFPYFPGYQNPSQVSFSDPFMISQNNKNLLMPWVKS